MELRKVVAIIRNQVLEDVEARLSEMRVKGISVTKVEGYGEFANYLNPDWTVTHSRVEIFTEKNMVSGIVEAIMDIAHTGTAGDGIVAVLPVEEIYRIRTKSAVSAEEV